MLRAGEPSRKAGGVAPCMRRGRGDGFSVCCVVITRRLRGSWTLDDPLLCCAQGPCSIPAASGPAAIRPPKKRKRRGTHQCAKNTCAAIGDEVAGTLVPVLGEWQALARDGVAGCPDVGVSCVQVKEICVSYWPVRRRLLSEFCRCVKQLRGRSKNCL